MPRARDELFEALCAACGWDWRDMTKTSRGRVNQALMELREVEATPQDVKSCARIYETLFEGAALTPQALVAHWPELKKRVRGESLRYDPEASFAAAVSKADLPELPAFVEVQNRPDCQVCGGNEQAPCVDCAQAAVRELTAKMSLPESQGWD